MSAEERPGRGRAAATAVRATAIVLFAWGSYVLYARTMVYLVMFLGRFWIAKNVDQGTVTSTAGAAAVDVALLALFCLPHSVMARRPFKAWLTRFVPPPLERSVYVLAASLLLSLCLWQWRPIPARLWHVTAEPLRTALRTLSAAGWVLGLVAIHTQGHFRLFGVRAGWRMATNRAPEEGALVTRGVYRRLRHPMYVGFLIGCFAGPTMSVGQLLFATVLLLYVLVGARYEERDLLHQHGDDYRRYRARVAAVLPGRQGAVFNDQS